MPLLTLVSVRLVPMVSPTFVHPPPSTLWYKRYLAAPVTLDHVTVTPLAALATELIAGAAT